MADLVALQRAFHDAITGAAPLDDARALVRDDGVDPSRRLRAYAHAYRVRLAGALETDYPKLRTLLGADAFEAMGQAYVRAHPPRHPSLRDLGLGLAAFLDATGADRLHVDLARLERARVEAFDAADAVPLGRDDLAGLAPEAFPRLRLGLVPSACVIELATNADDVWDAIEQDAPVPPGQQASRTVLVWRRELTVIHRTLDPDEAPAIRRMMHGADFGDVCARLTVERALELLLRWLDAAIVRSDHRTSAPA